jgi:hypothetical protein
VKLTNTQRRLLAAASQRDDGALKRPSQLTGGAAGKVVAKLLSGGPPIALRSKSAARCRIEYPGCIKGNQPEAEDEATAKKIKTGP